MKAKYILIWILLIVFLVSAAIAPKCNEPDIKQYKYIILNTFATTSMLIPFLCAVFGGMDRKKKK